MTSTIPVHPRPGSWGFSHHAEQRRLQMGLDAEEVFAALDGPLVTYPGRPGTRARVAVSRRLAVVHDADARLVVTVLWAGREGRAA